MLMFILVFGILKTILKGAQSSGCFSGMSPDEISLHSRHATEMVSFCFDYLMGELI